MSNICCITEKPDVCRDVAGAILKNAQKGNGYYYGNINGDTWVITSAYGHLLNLCPPEDYDPKFKNWVMEDLPLYFPNWKLKIPEGEKNAYKRVRLKLIKDLLSKSDMVVAAGDPDDEGQLLIDEIIDFFGYKGPVKRVFINDSMPDNIRKEFAHLKNNDDYRGLSKAAHARRMADFCFGINESRLAGLRLNRMGLAIGRVQTPTLGLVIARDMLIENHVKSKYYELSADIIPDEYQNVVTRFKFKPDKAYLKDNDIQHITDRDFVDTLGRMIKGKRLQWQTTVKEKVTNPPLPYNLTALSSDMNQRYGFSMQKTLDITQSLRSKHAITYNRSDSQYLKEEHFQDAGPLFHTIMDGTMLNRFELDFSRHSACFNDANVTAHHAIIPQKYNIKISDLTPDETKVYMAIAERYAMQFMKPLVQDVSTSVITIPYNGYTHTLEYVAYHTKEPGYTKYFKQENQEETLFFPNGNHTGVARDCKIDEKETKPPARYTEGTLGKDMASIAKYVTDPEIRDILKRKDEGKKGENGSIGTVATRGPIVEGLINRRFLERKGKNIISTPLGREFFALLPPSISKADTTARWWLIQEAIKDGSETDVNAIQKSVLEEFNSHKDTAYIGKTIKGQRPEKIKTEGVWNGRPVRINESWGEHTFTEQELEQLFAGNKITFDYNGRKVTGGLAEQVYKGRTYVGFLADEREKEEGYVYGKFKNKDIRFKETWGGHTFTAEEAEKLLNGEIISFPIETKSGETKTVSGKLAEQTYKQHKFFGFTMVETEKKDGYIYGTFRKKDIRFKDTWSGHKFTEEEADLLLKGKEITITAKKKNGEDWEVSGKLAQQSYNGTKFYGFKPDLK